MLASILSLIESKGSPDEIIEQVAEQHTGARGRILVAYNTRHGTTSSVGERIAGELTRLGFSVDLRSVLSLADDEDLSVYDGFVVGSAIYWAALTPEFVRFFEKHEKELSKKPYAVFAVCMTLIRDNEKNRGRVDSYIRESCGKLRWFEPMEVGRFAGRLQFQKLTWVERVIMRVILTCARLPGGDHRDWEKVTLWTRKVSEGFTDADVRMAS